MKRIVSMIAALVLALSLCLPVLAEESPNTGEVQKYGLTPREIYRLQICCEELIAELLNHAYPPEAAMVFIHLDVSYAEADRTTRILLNCAGEAYNPLEQEDEGLGVTILKKMAQRIDYAWDKGMNRISISL